MTVDRRTRPHPSLVVDAAPHIVGERITAPNFPAIKLGIDPRRAQIGGKVGECKIDLMTHGRNDRRFRRVNCPHDGLFEGRHFIERQDFIFIGKQNVYFAFHQMVELSSVALDAKGI